jgi:hypothetical protein
MSSLIDRSLLLDGVAAIAVFVALVFLMLKAAYWLGGKRAVWALGAVMVGLIAFEIFDVLRVCSAEPLYTSPECDDPARCGIGKATFACDGPVGAFAYGFALLVGPVAAACVGVLAWLVAQRPRKTGIET